MTIQLNIILYIYGTLKYIISHNGVQFTSKGVAETSIWGH